MRSLKYLFVLLCLFFVVGFSYAQKPPMKGGYATMRVFDVNRAASMGSGFVSAKIFIVYEDETTEEIELLPYSDKNELENLKKVNKVINQMKDKGYFLISQYTTGEQGNLVTDYTFLKQQ